MYIWIGCRLPEDFEKTLRGWVMPWQREPGLDFSGFSLPQHISLKISFEAGERYMEILHELEILLGQEGPITVEPTGVERQGQILWLAFRENAMLRRIHELLDRELEARFGIGQHAFDKEFLFHSTVCMGRGETLARIQGLLADIALPQELEMDTFLLGMSESGKSGSYRVVRRIPAEKV